MFLVLKLHSFNLDMMLDRTHWRKKNNERATMALDCLVDFDSLIFFKRWTVNLSKVSQHAQNTSMFVISAQYHLKVLSATQCETKQSNRFICRDSNILFTWCSSFDVPAVLALYCTRHLESQKSMSSLSWTVIVINDWTVIQALRA